MCHFHAHSDKQSRFPILLGCFICLKGGGAGVFEPNIRKINQYIHAMRQMQQEY